MRPRRDDREAPGDYGAPRRTHRRRDVVRTGRTGARAGRPGPGKESGREAGTPQSGAPCGDPSRNSLSGETRGRTIRKMRRTTDNQPA